MRRVEGGRSRSGPGLLLGALAGLLLASPALAQSQPVGSQAPVPGKSASTEAAPAASIIMPVPPAEVGGWPKVSWDNVMSVDYAHMSSNTGPDRGPGLVYWDDSTVLVEFNDNLSLSGWYQFKPRAPTPDNANRDVFINRGLNREEGGKVKELYIRDGDWRFGKFVPDFARAFDALPGPWASDLLEEAEEGYEAADMVGVEKLHVYDDENGGWQQITFTAFMVDRTFLHESWPFNEGIVHYKDGGVGNTRLPENIMVTWDDMNRPIGDWAHLTWQASAIRYGRSYGAQTGEWWGTLNGDLSIPLGSGGSVASTLSGHYQELHIYVEAVRRQNFNGFSGRARDFLSGSISYLNGPFVLDLASTQRWTTDDVLPLQKDELYSANIGYTFQTNTTPYLSVAWEKVGDHSGLYAGVRVTQTFTILDRGIAKGMSY